LPPMAQSPSRFPKFFASVTRLSQTPDFLPKHAANARNSRHRQKHGHISSTLHRGQTRPLLSTHNCQPSGIPRRQRHSRYRHCAFCASRSRSTSNGTRTGHGTRSSHGRRHPSANSHLNCRREDQTRYRQNNSGTSYCWTHGHTTNSSHPSTSCQKTSGQSRSHRHQDQHDGRLGPRLRLLGKWDG